MTIAVAASIRTDKVAGSPTVLRMLNGLPRWQRDIAHANHQRDTSHDAMGPFS